MIVYTVHFYIFSHMGNLAFYRKGFDIRVLVLLFQGSNLRGKEFNLTLHWHVMPKTGKMFADKIVMTGYRMPEEYR